MSSNPFIFPFDFEPEKIDPIPPNVLNYSLFMKQYVSANQLTDAQTTWFVTQIIKYVPLHLLCLWQGFPEWSITQKQITEARIQFQVSTQRTDPRLLVFNMDGRRLDQIII